MPDPIGHNHLPNSQPNIPHSPTIPTEPVPQPTTPTDQPVLPPADPNATTTWDKYGKPVVKTLQGINSMSALFGAGTFAALTGSFGPSANAIYGVGIGINALNSFKSTIKGTWIGSMLFNSRPSRWAREKLSNLKLWQWATRLNPKGVPAKIVRIAGSMVGAFAGGKMLVTGIASGNMPGAAMGASILTTCGHSTYHDVKDMVAEFKKD